MIPYIVYTSSDIDLPFLITSITSSGPRILKVLPDPDYPYANIVPLNPLCVYWSTVYLAAH